MHVFLGIRRGIQIIRITLTIKITILIGIVTVITTLLVASEMQTILVGADRDFLESALFINMFYVVFICNQTLTARLHSHFYAKSLRINLYLGREFNNMKISDFQLIQFSLLAYKVVRSTTCAQIRRFAYVRFRRLI